MRIYKIIVLFLAISILTNCASAYKMIKPKSINYVSTNETERVKIEYKYDLLHKKYAKKELKKGVTLVAIKITNNSDRDLKYGSDIKLTYENGADINVMENEKVFKTLKQRPVSFLLYLLLTPLNINRTELSDPHEIYEDWFYESRSTFIPIGLVLGPGLALGNLIVASSANKKFKTEILEYNICETIIKKGETKYGLIGIKTDPFNSLKLKVK
ncbi:hypothetical protein [Arenibacter sp. ARW7G5Y1]|uniref:hypothetical protein n=1 Tax=Arenibacter sp. ARW7G5Y1 TaxID=2135619 RepID=UPI000D755C78|nr:hypothetical protein [Arenibacter sp. ARW7G5Y1]PXX28330.1 hypothetical protein C7972_105185 [Arenibacter sp. ARW7G5Y1]